MLGNLLKNAVEASPDGGAVTLSIAARDGVRIALHNAGVVPEGIRETFFEKYSTAGKSDGTGLGNYSARLMARVQGGDMSMRTSASEGTTISVTLRAAPAGDVPESAGAEAAASAPAPAAALPPLRVLVVDDDEYNRLIVSRYLPSPPLHVDTAVNGRDAVDACEANPPDVVLMDLDMPIMGGFAAVDRIREREKRSQRSRCAIIALSSHDGAEIRRRCLENGFDAYLTKPVTREALLHSLHAIARADAASIAAGVRATKGAGPGDAVRVDADLKDLLPGFLASRRRAVAEIEAALQAGEAPRVHTLAHRLSGSFGLYGFRWAAEHCGRIEREAQSGDVRRLAEPIAALRSHLDSVEIRFGDAAQPESKQV
jgi:CheY-like chemotaxis protein